MRLDFYGNSVVMYTLEDGVITTKMIDARELTLALLREVPLTSGILPENTLWWQQGKEGPEVAIWQSPKLWRVAIETKAFQPPERLKIPMPGLIFVCQPGRAPKVYAAKSRPKSPESRIYHAPLFNIFEDGRTCPGTHKYPEDIAQIPNSFFTSFFTLTADFRGRSKRHPDSLIAMWRELNGKKRYPVSDLVPLGKVKDIMQ